MAQGMSDEYKRAYEKSGEAIRKFQAVQKAYRAREIGDNEFLRARRVYDAAMAEYDIAYAKEQERGEENRGHMARRARLTQNPADEDHLPYGEWIPAHAVCFNEDGTVSLMTESGRAQNGRVSNVADGYVDAAGRFHPIRWATDYDPDVAGEDSEYAIHPSSAYYKQHGLKVPKSAKRRRR